MNPLLEAVNRLLAWTLVRAGHEADDRPYRSTCRRLTLEWTWEFYRYRVREQFRRDADDFNLVDAGYCLDARDRIK